MQIANLKLVVAHVASVETFQRAHFEESPGSTLSKELLQVPGPFIHALLAFTEDDFQNYLILLLLDAIHRAKHMLLLDLSTVSWEGEDEVVFTDGRWLGSPFLFFLLFDYRWCNLAEGEGEEFFDALSEVELVLGLWAGAEKVHRRHHIFLYHSLELFFEHAFLVQ